ncbi:hypothetical protein FNV43_RR04184 [Rhamnella rubrinervis]|uniref:F-box domain-containing protein n=1 Tax=Rhamnella rubrinervis TaxID=2594499 RepID=A0A8K0MQ03_9ROSA|nr:hypothetical protein FNV43_RR04184 [Rhamnella rubrinervis]
MANCDAKSSLEQLFTNVVCMGITEDYIPKEIVEKVLLLLPVKSLIRFKCVSKSLCALIEHPSFRAKHLHNSKNNISSSSTTSLFLSFTFEERMAVEKHIFMNCNANHKPSYPHAIAAELPTLNIINTSEDDDVDHYYDKRLLVQCSSEYVKLPLAKDMIRDRRLVRICSQCDGLLCLFDEFGNFCLCNPSTKECRTLPPCLLQPQTSRGLRLLLPFSTGYYANSQGLCLLQYTSCGLGYDDKAKDYKIIRIVKTFPPGTEPPRAELYSLSSNSWREMDLSNIAEDLRCCFLCCEHKVYLKGVYYFLANGTDGKSKIVCFDMCEEEFNCISLPDFHSSYMRIAVWNERVVVFPTVYYGASTVQMWVMDGGNGGVRDRNSCFWTKHSEIRFAAGVIDPKPLLFWKNDDELLMEIFYEKIEKRKLISYNIGSTKFRNVPFGAGSSPHDQGYDSQFRVNNVVPYVKSLVSVKEGNRAC